MYFGSYSGAYPSVGLGSGGTFTNGSDYRIKENIEEITQSIDNLKPIKYNIIGNNEVSFGFLAHELQESFPELVEGEKDCERFQSVNYIGLIAVLTKELQDLKKRIAILEAQ